MAKQIELYWRIWKWTIPKFSSSFHRKSNQEKVTKKLEDSTLNSSYSTDINNPFA